MKNPVVNVHGNLASQILCVFPLSMIDAGLSALSAQ